MAEHLDVVGTAAHRAKTNGIIRCPGCGGWIGRGELVSLPPSGQGAYLHWWWLPPDDVTTSGNGAVSGQVSGALSPAGCDGGGRG